MNLVFLKTFLAVIETGNLNKAAERLNVTQSTVTARLDALEEALGRRLLVRSRRGAQMTRAGFELRPHAELLVNGWSQAQKAINLPEGYSGLFSFACEFDLWHGRGKPWLYGQRAAHPNLAFEARPGRQMEISSWLSSGLSDAAMLMEPVTGAGISNLALEPETLVFVSTEPRDRPLDKHPGYVHVDLGPGFRRAFAKAYPAARTAGMTVSLSVWALEHILTVGGSGYLPQDLVTPHLTAGRLHLITEAPSFTRHLYLVWRDSSEAIFPWLSDPLIDP